MGRQAKMRERDKKMVEDYYFHQKSMPEIAREQGITPQAVHKLIHSQKAEKYLSEIQERATKRARSFLIGISGKAARVMAEAMDEKDPYARIQAAREILERTGVKVENADISIEIEVPGQLVIGMPAEMEEGTNDEADA